jgi:N-acetylmuramoyl-L-alanine amidase
LSKNYSILFFILCAFFIFPVQANTKEKTFILVIDPGHGGKDAGAIGKKGKEKDINLAVSKLLGQYISAEHPDVKVIYTRSKDVFIGLDDRADIANKANANLFISVHTNAVDRKKSAVKGAEVYTFGLSRTKENLEVAKRENAVIRLEKDYEQKYEGFDPNSSESYIIFEFMQNKFVEQSINLASLVQKELVRTAKRGNRGVRQAEYLVLRKSSMPRILVELDFISNPESESYLLSDAGQRTMARAISNAFVSYKNDYDRKTSGSIGISRTKEQEEYRDVVIEKDVMVAKEKENILERKPAVAASSNLTYKVQILTSDKKLTARSPLLKGYKADFYIQNKMYKYTYGESSDWKEINKILKKVSKDFKDAFVITFENGVRIPNK